MFQSPSRLRLLVLVDLYVIHTFVTVMALRDFSLLGIFQQGFLNWGTTQIFSDLSVSLVFVTSWLIADARQRGVRAWPWVAATLVFGSLSPGLYLIVRELGLVRAAPTGSAPATVV